MQLPTPPARARDRIWALGLLIACTAAFAATALLAPLRATAPLPTPSLPTPATAPAAVSESEPATSPSQPETPEPSLSARALAAAYDNYDRSIRSAHWRQTVELARGQTDSVIRKSTQAFDDTGRWLHQFEDEVFDPKQGRLLFVGRTIFDGEWMYGHGRTGEAAGGTIQAFDGHRVSQLGFDCWIGRHEDKTGARSLADYLLAAPDLRAWRSEAGLPVLEATVLFPQVTALVEVHLDPSRGFAPQSITVRDRAIGVPYRRLHVTRWVEVDGLWLPAACDLESNYTELSEQDDARFADAMARHGLTRASDVRDPSVQRAYREVLQEAFGADEAPHLPLVPKIYVEFEYISLNTTLPEALFEAATPPDILIYDARHDTVRDPGATNWRPN